MAGLLKPVVMTTSEVVFFVVVVNISNTIKIFSTLLSLMRTHLLSCLAPLGLKSAHVSASVTPVFQFILGMAMMACKDLRGFLHLESTDKKKSLITELF